MPFDPLSFEHEETPDIAIDNGKVGVLNILVYAVITIACVYYLFTQWSPASASPAPEAVETNAPS